MNETEKQQGFRCPACGQAHVMRVDGFHLEMNKEMNVLTIDGAKLSEGSKLYVPEGHMVSCEECDEANLSENWVLAFEDPTMFFDMEALCHCGGELWMDQIPLSNQYGFVCEKCNGVKPNAKVSGA